MPYRTLYRDDEGTVHRDLDEAAITAAVHAGHGLLWVSIAHTDADDAAFLHRAMPFHALSIQDCLNPRYQRPKVDAFADHLFVMLHGINHDASGELVVTEEIDTFIGPNYVVTASLSPLAAIDHLFETAAQEGRALAGSSAMLAYAVFDALVDSMIPTVDVMGEFADGVEEEALTSPGADLLPDILRLKRSALRMHRVVVPQRDVLNRLARGEHPAITAEAIPYYRYVYDQLVRTEDLMQSVRERAESALTTHLSTVGIRQNETMRVLSIVASVFLPLTLLTGIFGMNFDYMPGLGWRYGYFTVLGVMLVVSGGVVWSFWAKHWFGAGRSHVGRVINFRVDPARLRATFTEGSRIRETVLDPRKIVRR
jgi:magnesium transporter